SLTSGGPRRRRNRLLIPMKPQNRQAGRQQWGQRGEARASASAVGPGEVEDDALTGVDRYLAGLFDRPAVCGPPGPDEVEVVAPRLQGRRLEGTLRALLAHREVIEPQPGVRRQPNVEQREAPPQGLQRGGFHVGAGVGKLGETGGRGAG